MFVKTFALEFLKKPLQELRLRSAVEAASWLPTDRPDEDRQSDGESEQTVSLTVRHSEMCTEEDIHSVRETS